MNKESLSQLLKSEIRNIPDFPKKGIQFKDITTILHNPQLNKMVLDCLIQDCKSLQIDVVVGLESRGFLYGNALAIAFGFGIRVGIEDNLWWDTQKSRLCTNFELVKRVHQLIELNGREYFPPAELGALGFYNQKRGSVYSQNG